MEAITEKGFVRPSYAQLLAAQEQRAKELLGGDVDTSEYSVLGKFLRIVVYDLAQLYEELEAVYFARFPGYAQGVQLDRLTPFAGVSRNPAVAAVYEVQFTGDAGAVIPEGFRVATADMTMYRTEAPATLGVDGTALASVVCTQRGEAGNVPPGSIVTVVNPVAQVRAVQQVRQRVPGRERESDAELRARFDGAIAGIGSATAEAVKAAVMRVAGVEGCVIAENDGEETLPGGLPPHSFETFVLGDTAQDTEIAAAIFSKKPMGVYSHGQVEAEVRDQAGNLHTLRFSRVAELRLTIRLSVKADRLFPAQGAKQVQQALAGYVNAFPNGKDLVFSSLYPVLYTVPGVVEVSKLEVSQDGGKSYGQKNVPASAAQAVRLDAGDVSVEVSAYADQ